MFMGNEMAQSVATFGLYLSSRALHFGAEALRAARFRHTDISVMSSDGLRALRLHEQAPANRSVADDVDAEPAPSLAALLTSLSGVGAVSMSDDGPFMAGGPILATVTGGEPLLASLRGLGIPDRDITAFEARLRQGGLLLSVQCDDHGWARRAREILEQTGAAQVAATV